MKPSPSLVLAEPHTSGIVLRDLAGRTPAATPGRARLLMLSRRACMVGCIEVPPVPRRELPGLLRYRARAIYPGNLDEAVIGFLLQRRGGRRVALVGILERGVRDMLLRDAPRARIGLFCAMAVALEVCPQEGWTACWSPAYIELLRHRAGLLVDSTLVARTGRGSDVRRVAQLIRRLQGPEPAPPASALLVLAPEAQLPGILRQWTAAGLEPVPRTRPLETLPITARRFPNLFRTERPPPVLRPVQRWTLAVCAAVLVFFGCLEGVIRLKQAELDRLRIVTRNERRAELEVQQLAAESAALRERVSALILQRPVDLSTLLASLRESMGPGIRVRDLVVKRDTFVLQASGPAPLAIMQRLVADPRFQEVRLVQLSAAAREGHQFTISGRYAP